MKAEVIALFDEIDQHREFCVRFGFPFNEYNINTERSFIGRQYKKFKEGKRVPDQWKRDAKNFERKPFEKNDKRPHKPRYNKQQ